MPTKRTVRVLGVERTTRRLVAYGVAVEARLQKLVIEYARRIEQTAQQTVPVDTGALQRSIRVALEHLAAEIVAGNDEVDYAGFVELGTSRQAAQPYLLPAFEEHLPDFRRAVRRATKLRHAGSLI